jgi:hypothetical protein
MTIQRQYSLPNCNLVLEGLNDTTDSDTVRPLLTILVNAECHFNGHEQPITGGRDFLDSLTATVSSYAQEFLSGVHHLQPSSKPALVQLQKVGNHLHRLTVQPKSLNSHHENGEPTHLDLGTVQLFDLVEAIDQLFADPQTLPDLALQLTPVSKRNVTSTEPMSKRAVPAAIGVSGLAAAAALLFFVPIPEVKRPQPTGSSAEPEATATTSATSSAGAIASGSPNATSPAATSPAATSSAVAVSPPASSSPSASPTVAASSPVATSPLISPAATSPSSSPPSGAPIDAAQLGTLLNTAPAVTDATTLRRLSSQLRDQLDQAWTKTPRFDNNLVYRVGVSENGDILGFKYVNQDSIAHVDQTPLPDLRYNSVDPNATSREPIAQLRVVFTPQGAVEVSPWAGYRP